MSSGPGASLDPREYGYQFFAYRPADANVHTISTNQQWLVTRIQMWAGPTLQLDVNLDASVVSIAPDGCLDLEPNGAYRGDIIVQGGTDSIVVIEFWYQSTPGGTALVPVVT